jgi:polyhydroxybutyrate depolymerase
VSVPSSAPASALEVPREQTLLPRDLAPGDRRPLLVFLHGLGASGKIVMELPGLRAFAEQRRLVLIAPDGSSDSTGRRFWNAHPACCNFENRDVDDVARLGGLIEHWAARPEVDRKRVYVVGFSNGAFMAQRLACKLGDRIAGIVSIAGAGPDASETCTIAGPLAVLAIHGDADQIVRYEGGSLFGHQARHGSARQVLRDWATRLDCEGQPATGPKLDLNRKLGGTETETTGFDRCKRGSAALWTVAGGSHYIGSDPALMEQAWRFLEGTHK